MRLKEALRALAPFDAGVALTLATEGFKPEENGVLAVTLAPLDGGPPATLYVEGSDPTAAAGVNNIDVTTYKTLALPKAAVWTEVLRAFSQHPFVITHNAPWACAFLRKLRDLSGPDPSEPDWGRLVDTLALARARGVGCLAQLAARDTVTDLTISLNTLPVPKRSDAGCSLKALAAETSVRMDAPGPLCERNAVALREVFERMLEHAC